MYLSKVSARYRGGRLVVDANLNIDKYFVGATPPSKITLYVPKFVKPEIWLSAFCSAEHFFITLVGSFWLFLTYDGNPMTGNNVQTASYLLHSP